VAAAKILGVKACLFFLMLHLWFCFEKPFLFHFSLFSSNMHYNGANMTSMAAMHHSHNGLSQQQQQQQQLETSSSNHQVPIS
jgi:hypothetical protein